MSADKFTATKEQLVYCPTCGGKLFDCPDNGVVRTCLVHGNVFAIMPLLNGEYRVEVGLDAR